MRALFGTSFQEHPPEQANHNPGGPGMRTQPCRPSESNFRFFETSKAIHADDALLVWGVALKVSLSA